MPSSPIVLNPENSASYTVICLHGLGADAKDLLPLAQQMKKQSTQPTRYLLPNAPKRPITAFGGMPLCAWYDIENIHERAQEDSTGIRQSAQEIQALIEKEIQHGIPSTHIFLLGFSQGAAMSLHIGLRYPEPLGGIIALSGYLPLGQTLATERHLANKAIPIFMAHGLTDEIVSLAYAERSKVALQQQGYAVDFHTYAMGHSITPDELLDLMRWLRQAQA